MMPQSSVACPIPVLMIMTINMAFQLENYLDLDLDFFELIWVRDSLYRG